MMVEFIGSTGAGKTTVAAAVQRRLAVRGGTQTAPDLVASLVGLRPLARPFYRNLACDLVGLPFVLGSLGRQAAFLRFVLQVLARQPLTLQAANRVRSTLRKIGVYEIIQRYGGGRIVLVDEGTILHAHNLFVYTSQEWSPEDLDRFARVVPMPDVVVYVTAPLALQIRRSLERSDPPREIRSRNPRLVELYVARASALFEALVGIPSIGERVVRVDNSGDQRGPDGPDVERVVASIMEKALRAGDLDQSGPPR